MVQKVAGGHNCWEADPQVCADQISTWISAWAGETLGLGGGTTELDQPPLYDPGDSKNFPVDSGLFETTVYPATGAALQRMPPERCRHPASALPGRR